MDPWSSTCGMQAHLISPYARAQARRTMQQAAELQGSATRATGGRGGRRMRRARRGGARAHRRTPRA